MWFLPTIRKCYTLSLKFGRSSIREKKRRSLSLGGFALFINPYDYYFNIKRHHFMFNQRIFVGLMVMMNPYKQRLAFLLWFLGFWPMSVLQSHLPTLYLRISVHICVEVTTLTWSLDKAISLKGTTYLSHLGCSALSSTALDLATLKLYSDMSLCNVTGA